MSEKRPRVAILDLGMGNLFSVRQACLHTGMDAVVTSSAADLKTSDAVIMPGVGAFGDAMDGLRRLGLVDVVRDWVSSGKPFFGICLGMQLLMERSEEFGDHEGLGILPGRVVRFSFPPSSGPKVRVPEMGWNRIGQAGMDWGKTPLVDVNDGSYMYFVHSYYVVPSDKSVVCSETVYGGVRYCSSLRWKNVFACQFHPERSGEKGLQIYRSFADQIK